MFTADVRVQVPPRPPKEKDIRKDVLFLLPAGLERAAPVCRLVQKLRAGEQFLARGKVLLFRSAVLWTVKRDKTDITGNLRGIKTPYSEIRTHFGVSVFFIWPAGLERAAPVHRIVKSMFFTTLVLAVNNGIMLQ